jgi:hypothetical protein
MAKGLMGLLKPLVPKQMLFWWVMKKGLLVLSATGSLAAIIYWVISINQISNYYIAAGVIAGLLSLLLCLRSLSRLTVNAARAIFLFLLAAAYVAVSVLYIYGKTNTIF